MEVNVKIKVDDPVWVKLTKDGARILGEYVYSLLENHNEIERLEIVNVYTSLYAPINGWVRFQFWDLARIFGKHTDCSSIVNVFREGTISLTDPNSTF